MLDTLTITVSTPDIDISMRITAFVLMALGLFVKPMLVGRRAKPNGNYLPTCRYLRTRMDKNLPLLIVMAVVAYAAPREWFWYVADYEVYDGLPLGMLGAFVVGFMADVIVGKLLSLRYPGNGGA